MISMILGLIVALAHIYFFILESFCYTRPLGRKILGVSAKDVYVTKKWALNQGYYNLLIAIGILASVTSHDIFMFTYLMLFVVSVGVVGAITVKPKIFWFQAFPALLALIFIKL